MRSGFEIFRISANRFFTEVAQRIARSREAIEASREVIKRADKALEDTDRHFSKHDAD